MVGNAMNFENISKHNWSGDTSYLQKCLRKPLRFHKMLVALHRRKKQNLY